MRVANNQEVHQLYDQASETYRTLEDRLQQADTPQELVDISNDLDVAIWQLDCAEAVLDGKPKPPKPEQKILEPPAPAPGDRVTIPAPRPDYQRRPSRRSSYMGPGMMDILIGVAGQVLAGGSTGRRRRRSWLDGWFVRHRATPADSTPAARSGGGGVIPGPGSPVRRSSPRSSARRSSGGPSWVAGDAGIVRLSELVQGRWQTSTIRNTEQRKETNELSKAPVGLHHDAVQGRRREVDEARGRDRAGDQRGPEAGPGAAQPGCQGSRPSHTARVEDGERRRRCRRGPGDGQAGDPQGRGSQDRGRRRGPGRSGRRQLSRSP